MGTGSRSRVTAIWRGPLERLPSAIKLLMTLRERGAEVELICGSCGEDNLERMARAGIGVHQVGGAALGSEGIGRKFHLAYRFRREVWRAIREQGGGRVLWVLNGHTAIVLGRALLRERYVLHLYELEEGVLFRRLLRRYVQGAYKVVCAQETRAAIVRCWYGLERTPVVIENYPHVPEAGMEEERLPAEVAAALAGIETSTKILLYQGVIRRDRDIRVVAKAIEGMYPRWQLVLMGEDEGFAGEVLEGCRHALYVGRVAAPNHLLVTRRAAAGLVIYDYESLNNLFCAPNKIYEYAAFGAPMVCNDVPGLRATVGRYGAGVCCDCRDEAEVRAAIGRLERDGEELGRGALRLYRDGNPSERVGEMVEQFAERGEGEGG